MSMKRVNDMGLVQIGKIVKGAGRFELRIQGYIIFAWDICVPHCQGCLVSAASSGTLITVKPNSPRKSLTDVIFQKE